jgi:hypothetical protein
MTSPSGFIFGIVNIVGNFGTVFVDQSYWQSAIAVKPEMAASGYILGGVVWFAVPMMMGSTHGLVGRALTMDSSLVNGPAHITAEDSGSGLTPARVAVAILGEGGAWILLLMLFMAIVSTGCAEIIAVATILTYDVYCEYIKPELKEPRMKARSVFYSTLLGKSEYTVEEQADKSVEKIPVTEVGATLDKLEAAGILAEAKFEEAEKKAVEGALAAYVEKDGTVTCELVYFAVQSQVLAKKSLESGVMLRVMKFFCVCFAVFMGFNALILQAVGLGLGFVYMSMGIFVGPAVAPAAMAILMEKASATWCTLGAILGLIGGLTTWFVTAWITMEEITLSSLGGDYPFLFSNIVSICFSGLVAIGGSLAMPDAKFQWKTLAVQLPLVDDMPPPIDDGRSAAELDEFLIKSYWRSVASTLFLFFFLCGLFPVVLFVSGMVFGSTGFGIWITAFGLWCFIGGMSVIVLPIYDFKKDVDAAAQKRAAIAGASK